MYEARVERQIEAAHHNGPKGSRCHTNHGHTWRIVVVFAYTTSQLNEWGWGPDFGEIKKIIDWYDHQDLNDKMGPEFPPSAENFARLLFDQFKINLGFTPKYVQLSEGGGNSVRYYGHD